KIHKTNTGKGSQRKFVTGSSPSTSKSPASCASNENQTAKPAPAKKTKKETAILIISLIVGVTLIIAIAMYNVLRYKSVARTNIKGSNTRSEQHVSLCAVTTELVEEIYEKVKYGPVFQDST